MLEGGDIGLYVFGNDRRRVMGLGKVDAEDKVGAATSKFLNCSKRDGFGY